MRATLTLLTLLAVHGAADARPTVVIDHDVPLDARELRDAIELRIEGDLTIRITRAPSGAIIVDVGGRRETLDLGPEDPTAAARVVAMIAFALALDPVPVALPAPAPVLEQPPTITQVLPQVLPTMRSRFELRLVPIALQDDGRYTYALFTGSVAYRLSSHVNLVGTAGIGRMNEEKAFPFRFGIEGVAGALGLELGGIVTQHSSACGSAQTGGVYGAARIHIPVTPRARVVLEGGGYFVLTQPRIDFAEMTCSAPLWQMPSAWQSYAGWVGAGVGWSL
jgi:hypothetical protein